jgi:GntR family transcriptional regulator, histidine utilization repressor
MQATVRNHGGESYGQGLWRIDRTRIGGMAPFKGYCCRSVPEIAFAVEGMNGSPTKPHSLDGRIRADIEGKILSGKWPPGYRIPIEHDLSRQYRCSRMTVSKVLSRLAEIGLIERRKRAGSFVSKPRVQSAVLEIPDIRAEIVRRGHDYRYELLSRRRRKANTNDRNDLVVPNGTEILALTCRHRAGPDVFCFEERLLNLSAVPAADSVDFSSIPPGTWMLDHVPWTEAEHRIHAISAGIDYAKLLDFPQDTACLIVERRTWRDECSITRVRQTFPGHFYDLIARFAPSRDASPMPAGR